MGQTLAVAANWTTAKEGAKGKLEYTDNNEMILNKIIQFIEGFSSSHSAEAEIEFSQPLTWKTALKPGDFEGGEYNTT